MWSLLGNVCWKNLWNYPSSLWNPQGWIRCVCYLDTELAHLDIISTPAGYLLCIWWGSAFCCHFYSNKQCFNMGNPLLTLIEHRANAHMSSVWKLMGQLLYTSAVLAKQNWREVWRNHALWVWMYGVCALSSHISSFIHADIVIIEALIGAELASLRLPALLKSWPNFSRVQ